MDPEQLRNILENLGMDFRGQAQPYPHPAPVPANLPYPPPATWQSPAMQEMAAPGEPVMATPQAAPNTPPQVGPAPGTTSEQQQRLLNAMIGQPPAPPPFDPQLQPNPQRVPTSQAEGAFDQRMAGRAASAMVGQPQVPTPVTGPEVMGVPPVPASPEPVTTATLDPSRTAAGAAVPRSGGDGSEMVSTFGELIRGIGGSALRAAGLNPEGFAKLMVGKPGSEDGSGMPTQQTAASRSAPTVAQDPNGQPGGSTAASADPGIIASIMRMLVSGTPQGQPPAPGAPRTAGQAWGDNPLNYIPQMPDWRGQMSENAPLRQAPGGGGFQIPGGLPSANNAAVLQANRAPVGAHPGMWIGPGYEPNAVPKPQTTAPGGAPAPRTAAAPSVPTAATAAPMPAPAPMPQGPAGPASPTPAASSGGGFSISPTALQTLGVIGSVLMQQRPGENWLGTLGRGLGAGQVYNQMLSTSAQEQQNKDRQLKVAEKNVGITERKQGLAETMAPAEMAERLARIRSLDARIGMERDELALKQLKDQRDSEMHAIALKFAPAERAEKMALVETQIGQARATTAAQYSAAADKPRDNAMKALEKAKGIDGSIDYRQAGTFYNVSVAGLKPLTPQMQQEVNAGIAAARKLDATAGHNPKQGPGPNERAQQDKIFNAAVARGYMIPSFP